MNTTKKFNLPTKTAIIEIITIALIFLTSYTVNKSNYVIPTSLSSSDMGNEFDQVKEFVRDGKNPYERILNGNMIENNKYATLFPLYYLIFMLIGIPTNWELTPFVETYRIVIQFAAFVSFLSIYQFFRKRDLKTFGIIAASFFIFNRWTLLSMATLKQDIIAITFLLVAFNLLEEGKKASALFIYGISLGLKHMGIFAAPLFLFELLSLKDNPKVLVKSFGLASLPILLPSIPYLILNAKAFVLSLAFSLTRKPISSCGSKLFGYDRILVNYNHLDGIWAIFFMLLPRLPLVIFLTANFYLFFSKFISKYAYLLLNYLVFAALNPVYFDQYSLWIVPFVFLALVEVKSAQFKEKA